MNRRLTQPNEIVKGSRIAARRRSMIRLSIAWLVAAVVLGGIIYALIATNALMVQRVRVEGVKLADPARVAEALIAKVSDAHAIRAWMSASYTPFWLFLKTPESFFAAYPIFRTADIAVHPFTREVVVTVMERSFFGAWCLTGGTCYAFDDQGVVFGAAPSLKGTVVTKVDDARRDPLHAGDPVLRDTVWRERFFETLGIISRAHLTPRTITVKDEELREWDVMLAEGPVLQFSFMFVPARLDEALATLSARSDFRALAYLDFRVPDRLFYK